MAFRVPTFNLLVNIWRNGGGPPALPDVITVGNLTPGRRTITPSFLHGGGATIPAQMYVLLPIATDVRDGKAAGGADVVEIPAGTGRIYDVDFVDDVGMGFLNEHRLAQLVGRGPWPVPFPAGDVPLVVVGGVSCALSSQLFLGVQYSCHVPLNSPDLWFVYNTNLKPLGSFYTIYISGLHFFGGSFVAQGLCPPGAIQFLINPPPSFTFQSLTSLQNILYVVHSDGFSVGPLDLVWRLV